MWNPFKRKLLVPISDCFESVKQAIIEDNFARSKDGKRILTLWEWLEVKHGVQRKWSWRTHTNYLVFENERDYTIFLLKL